MKRLISFITTIFILLTSIGVVAVKEDITEQPKKEQILNPYEILWALDIVRGEYNEDEKVTRGKMADVAVGLSNLRSSAMVNKVVDFIDITPEHKYYQSLIIAVDTGMMKGFGDNSFKPDEPIILEHTVNVVLSVLGYKSDVIKQNAETALALAIRLNLLKNIEQEINEPITLKNLCILSKNVLDTKILEKSYSSDEKYSISKLTLLEEAFKISSKKSIVTATNITALNPNDRCSSEGYLTLDKETYLYSGKDYQNLLGKRVNVYYQNENSSEPKIFHLEELNNTITQINGDEVTEVVKGENIVLKYDVLEKTKKIITVNKPFVIYNGKSTEYDKMTKEELTDISAQYTFIDNNTDGIMEGVFIKKGISVSVDKVINSDKTLYFTYETIINNKKMTSFSFEKSFTNGNLNVLKDEKNIEFQKIAQGDIVTFYSPKDDNDYLTIEVSTKKIEGLISTISKDKKRDEYVIGEDKYKLSSEYEKYLKDCNKKFNVNDEGIFSLNIKNEIAYCELYSESDKIYGFLTDMGTDNGIDSTVKMKILTQKNKFEIFDLCDKVNYIRRGVNLGKVPSDTIERTFSPYYDGYQENKILYSKNFAEYSQGTVVTPDMMGSQCVEITDGMKVVAMDGNNPMLGIFKPNATSRVVFKFDSSESVFSKLKLKVSGRGIMGCDLNLMVGESIDALNYVSKEFPDDTYFANREVNLTEYVKGKSSIYVGIEFINTRPNDTWSWLESIEAFEEITINQGDLIRKKNTLYEKNFDSYPNDTIVTKDVLGEQCIDISGKFQVRELSNALRDTKTIFAPNATGKIKYKFTSKSPNGFDDLKLSFTGRCNDFDGGNGEQLKFYAQDEEANQSSVYALPSRETIASGTVDFSEFAKGKRDIYIIVEITNENNWNWAFLQNLNVKEEYEEAWYPEEGSDKFTTKSMQLIRFKLNDNKEITTLETALPLEILESYDNSIQENNTFRLVGAKGVKSYYDYGRCFGGSSNERTMSSSKTLCFNIPGDPATDDEEVFNVEKRFSVTNWPGRSGAYNVAFYDTDSLGFAPVMVNYGGSGRKNFNYAENFSVVKKVASAINDDGDIVTKLYAYNMQGQLLEYTPKDTESDIFKRKIDGKYFQFGDVVQFAIPGNEVEAFNTIFTTDPKNQYYGITYTDLENQIPNTSGEMPAYGNQSSDLRVMTGIVKKVAEDFIQLYTGPNFDILQTWYVDGSKIALDVDMEKEVATPMKYSELKEGDFVVLRQQWSMIINIIKLAY